MTIDREIRAAGGLIMEVKVCASCGDEATKYFKNPNRSENGWWLCSSDFWDMFRFEQRPEVVSV